jgi:predicted nuclease of predicted toxin-antitoxin system
VKFLIDNALSIIISRVLTEHGHDCDHVRDIGLQDASDEVIFVRAQADGRVVVSADTDFGTLLALRQVTSPSVILFRGEITRVPSQQVALLLANLRPSSPRCSLAASSLWNARVCAFDLCPSAAKRKPIVWKDRLS